MMWHTKKVYADIFDKRVVPEERFTKNLPDWSSMDKWGESLLNRSMFVGLYIGFYILFAPYWWLFALIPIHILMGPVHGVIINWFAHKYGKVSYNMTNTSKNFIPIDVLMLGENYHNNHHKFPSSANFGIKWYEIDPIYYILRVLNFLSIIKIRNRGKYEASAFEPDTQAF